MAVKILCQSIDDNGRAEKLIPEQRGDCLDSTVLGHLKSPKAQNFGNLSIQLVEGLRIIQTHERVTNI